MSPRAAESLPSRFARLVADALADEMSSADISITRLAPMVGRSKNYLANRFRHEAAFTLTDVDDICQVLGLDPVTLIGALRRRR